MWHVSSSHRLGEPAAWAAAERALDGVGDPALGEWCERGRGGVVHLRRRLTAEERAVAGGLEVRDVRGTDEERRRITNLRRDLPRDLLDRIGL